MNKFNKTVLAVVAVAGIMLTSACTNDTKTVDKSENADVVSVYETFVDETYNHGKSADELDALNNKVVDALGSQGTDYDAAISVLTPEVPIKYAYIPENDENYTQLTSGLTILSLMLSNTANDKVAVKVDTSGIAVEGDTATIDRKKVKFSSENNDTTGLATLLNDNAQQGGTTEMHLTKDGWKIDVATFQATQ
jgi:hypothetical protein